MSFLRGNCIKYLWRAGIKADPLADLEKSLEYLELLKKHPDWFSNLSSDAAASYKKFRANELSMHRRAAIHPLVTMPAEEAYLPCSIALKEWMLSLRIT